MNDTLTALVVREARDALASLPPDADLDARLRAAMRAASGHRTVNERDVPIPPDHPLTDDAAALLARACRPSPTGEPARPPCPQTPRPATSPTSARCRGRGCGFSNRTGPWWTSTTCSGTSGGGTRYAGAVRWSVLQHTALCLRIFDTLLVPVIGPARLTRRYVVAHDLHEGYVLDLPSGLKRRLPEYKTRIENPWEAHVHASLGLAWPLPLDAERIVKQVDGLALVAEMTLLGHAFRDVAARRRQVDPTTLPVLHGIAGQVSGRYEDELRSEVRAALEAA